MLHQCGTHFRSIPFRFVAKRRSLGYESADKVTKKGITKKNIFMKFKSSLKII